VSACSASCSVFGSKAKGFACFALAAGKSWARVAGLRPRACANFWAHCCLGSSEPKSSAFFSKEPTGTANSSEARVSAPCCLRSARRRFCKRPGLGATLKCSPYGLGCPAKLGCPMSERAGPFRLPPATQRPGPTWARRALEQALRKRKAWPRRGCSPDGRARAPMAT
jgi:hypothetical protein